MAERSRATFTVDQVIDEIDKLSDDEYLDTEFDDVTDDRNERNEDVEEANDKDVYKVIGDWS